MATYNAGNSGDKKVAFAYDGPPSHPPSLLPPPYANDGGSSSHQSQGMYPFAPSPYGDPTTPLSGDNPKGFKQHLKNLAPGKSPSKLLDPPPPSFTRPPPIDLPYGAFPVMELICEGSTLDKGFPYAAPACPIEPHPFVTHDVNENDWRWFLHDVRVAGSLSPMNRVVAGVLPIVFPLGLVLGVAAAFGTERYLKSRKKGPVSELIDYWNTHFFHLRSIHVALSRGKKSKRQGPQPSDGKWRLVISYKPCVLPAVGGSYRSDLGNVHSV
ncbi:hypothetical protein ACG7TL_001214 [Trametes sanguinea]